MTSCSKQSQLSDKTRLLGALSSWILKAAKVGDSTTSLGNSFVCKRWYCCSENSFSFLSVAGVESTFVQSVLGEIPYGLSQLCTPSLQ